MHFFGTIIATLSAATIADAAAISERAISAQAMVTNINKITQLSLKLQPVASNIQTGQNIVYKRQDNPFEPVINGLSTIISTAKSDSKAMSGTQPYPAADANQVCTAFTNFVIIHQELLKILIGKSGLLEGVFLGPVAATLRTLEDAVDTLAFGIIDVVPACEADATKKKEQLDDTLGQAVCAYTPGGSLGVNAFC